MGLDVLVELLDVDALDVVGGGPVLSEGSAVFEKMNIVFEFVRNVKGGGVAQKSREVGALRRVDMLDDVVNCLMKEEKRILFALVSDVEVDDRDPSTGKPLLIFTLVKDLGGPHVNHSCFHVGLVGGVLPFLLESVSDCLHLG